MSGGRATGGGDLLASCCCRGLVYVEDSNRRTLRRERQGNGLPNTAAAACDYGNFTVQPERPFGICVGQSETPRFQGMKSS